MINLIIQQINTDLVKDVGLNSSYNDEKVESIQRSLPETIPTNTFIGIVAGPKVATNYEIGQRMPKFFVYQVNLAVLVKDFSLDDGINRLSRIEKRVLKSIANSKVLTLVYDEDTIRETPVKMVVSNIDYEFQEEEKGALAYLAIITLEITTEFTI